VGFERRFSSAALAFLMMHKNGQQNDDRERNADQPKQ
jgi:hypothetical protein